MADGVGVKQLLGNLTGSPQYGWTVTTVPDGYTGTVQGAVLAILGPVAEAVPVTLTSPAGAELETTVDVTEDGLHTDDELRTIAQSEAQAVVGAVETRVTEVEDALPGLAPLTAVQTVADDLTAEGTTRADADTALDGRLDDVEVALPLKADLVDGTVPDAQIPASIARDTEVAAAVAALVASAPATLDTLDEIAAALGDDPNLSTTLTTLVGTKETPAGAQAKADAAQAAAVQRANHTGEQAVSTVTGLQAALDAKATTAALTAESTARGNADTALDGRVTTLEAAVRGAKATEAKTRNNTTTLEEIPGLSLSVAANTVYKVDVFLPVTGPAGGDAADVKVGWNYPPGAVMQWTTNAVVLGVSGASASINRQTYGIGSEPTFGATTTESVALLTGYITTSTAGTLALKVAQASAFAGDTVVSINARMVLARVA